MMNKKAVGFSVHHASFRLIPPSSFLSLCSGGDHFRLKSGGEGRAPRMFEFRDGQVDDFVAVRLDAQFVSARVPQKRERAAAVLGDLLHLPERGRVEADDD